MQALVRLRTEVTPPRMSQADLDLQLASYTERLLEYPLEHVLPTLRQWPADYDYWPKSWKALKAELDARIGNAEAAARPRVRDCREPTPQQRAAAREAERWARMPPAERRAETDELLAKMRDTPLGRALRQLGSAIRHREAG